MQLIYVGFCKVDPLYLVFAFHCFSCTLCNDYIFVLLNSRFCAIRSKHKSPFEWATICLYLSPLLFSFLVTTKSLCFILCLKANICIFIILYHPCFLLYFNEQDTNVFADNVLQRSLSQRPRGFRRYGSPANIFYT